MREEEEEGGKGNNRNGKKEKPIVTAAAMTLGTEGGTNMAFILEGLLEFDVFVILWPASGPLFIYTFRLVIAFFVEALDTCRRFGARSFALAS